MFVTAIQSFSVYSCPKVYTPSFEGKKSIDLNYILKKRSNLLPPRVYEKVVAIVNSNPQKMPTLMEVHKEIYSPLLECKTLDEAKEIFSEFYNVRKAEGTFKRNRGNIKKLKMNGALQDNLSLKLLQDVWVNLKSQDEIAEELGLKGRSALGWVLKKINFAGYSSNYRTLLMSSNPETRAVIAAKTTAWNACHPDLMYKKNKYAAQFCKTPEYRKEHSKRMIEYDNSHPERRAKIREFDLAVWQKVPEIRKAMSEFAALQDPFTKTVIKKEISHIALNPCEIRVRKNFYKRFWQANPDLRKKFKEAFKQVKEERALLKDKEKPESL